MKSNDGQCWAAGGRQVFSGTALPVTDVIACNASDPRQWWKRGADGTIRSGGGGCLTDLLTPDKNWPR